MKEAKFCQERDSTLIALALELEDKTPSEKGSHRMVLNPCYGNMVQVMNIETREILMQHDFGDASHGFYGRVKMCWSGPHLLVAYKRDIDDEEEVSETYDEEEVGDTYDEEEVKEEFSLFAWQAGAKDLLPIDISFKLDMHIDLVDMYGDHQEITVITREDLWSEGEEKNYIYKYVP